MKYKNGTENLYSSRNAGLAKILLLRLFVFFFFFFFENQFYCYVITENFLDLSYLRKSFCNSGLQVQMFHTSARFLSSFVCIYMCVRVIIFDIVG